MGLVILKNDAMWHFENLDYILSLQAYFHWQESQM
jgi:hypothetical protein